MARSINGWKHLDNSNIDWGQDMIYVREWVKKHPEARPLYIHPSGYVSAEQMRIPSDAPPATAFAARDATTNGRRQFAPGWYIMGLSRLADPQNPWHELLQREPDDYINYSMRIYHAIGIARILKPRHPEHCEKPGISLTLREPVPVLKPAVPERRPVVGATGLRYTHRSVDGIRLHYAAKIFSKAGSLVSSLSRAGVS